MTNQNVALEAAKDALKDFEAIYGTKSYTGNRDRDAEYAALKRVVKDIKDNSEI